LLWLVAVVFSLNSVGQVNLEDYVCMLMPEKISALSLC